MDESLFLNLWPIQVTNSKSRASNIDLWFVKRKDKVSLSLSISNLVFMNNYKKFS